METLCVVTAARTCTGKAGVLSNKLPAARARARRTTVCFTRTRTQAVAQMGMFGYSTEVCVWLQSCDVYTPVVNCLFMCVISCDYHASEHTPA